MQVKDSAVVTIGLFGTCGGSHWRAPFEATYAEKGIAYFNPQVEDWDPSMAEIEADHLAEDEIILFPITGETYGTGSLAETGFSILQAIQLDNRRDFIILIERELDPKLMENPTLAKDSTRARALVYQHLKKLRLANVYVVESLDDMLAISLVLYEAAKLRKSISQFSLT